MIGGWRGGELEESAARAEAEKHTWAEYRRKFFAAYANVIG